jgi:hypothetical protein
MLQETQNREKKKKTPKLYEVIVRGFITQWGGESVQAGRVARGGDIAVTPRRKKIERDLFSPE